MATNEKSIPHPDLSELTGNRVSLADSFEDLSSKTKDKQRVTFPVYFAVFIVTFCGILTFGWNLSVLNNPQSVLMNFFNQSYTDRNNKAPSPNRLEVLWAMCTSIYAIGGAIGGLLCNFIADKFGRKRSLMYANAIAFTGVLLMTIAKYINSFESAIAGRFFLGIHGGINTALGPLYLNEISTTEFRGFVSITSNVGIAFGAFIATIFGLGVVLGNERLFPVLLGLQFIPTILQVLGLLICTETPRYLYINENNEEGARKALVYLRKRNDRTIDAEIEVLKNEKQISEAEEKVKLHELFTKKAWRKRTIIAIALHMGQQLSGINGLLFYSTILFKSAGLSEENASYATLSTTGMLFLSAAFGAFFIDRVGRLPLLSYGFTGMAICAFSLVPAIKYSNGSQVAGIFAVILSIAFTGFFSAGPGGIPWMITAEIFPQNARVIATSLTVVINWMLNFVIIISYPFIQQSLKEYSFIIFGALALFFAIFTALYIPETKGKTQEEIERLFT